MLTQQFPESAFLCQYHMLMILYMKLIFFEHEDILRRLFASPQDVEKRILIFDDNMHDGNKWFQQCKQNQ